MPILHVPHASAWLITRRLGKAMPESVRTTAVLEVRLTMAFHQIVNRHCCATDKQDRSDQIQISSS